MKFVSLLRLELIGLTLLSALFFWVQTLFVQPKSLKRIEYVAPPLVLTQLTIGLGKQLSDIFWIRAIQDFDFCEQKINQSECKGQSWLFKILNLVVELDTKFEEAHFYGGLALSVLISDYEGATQIFDKGADRFPNSWTINYVAGYHAMIEEKDYVKAAKRYSQAALNGAPSWVHLLAGRMAAQGGDAQLSLQILEYMQQHVDNPKYIERLKEKIKSSGLSLDSKKDQ